MADDAIEGAPLEGGAVVLPGTVGGGANEGGLGRVFSWPGIWGAPDGGIICGMVLGAEGYPEKSNWKPFILRYDRIN